MKKIIILLSLFFLISCNRQQDDRILMPKNALIVFYKAGYVDALKNVQSSNGFDENTWTKDSINMSQIIDKLILSKNK